MAEHLTPKARLFPLLAGGVFIELLLLSLYFVPRGGSSVIAFMVVHATVYLVLGFLWWRRDSMFPLPQSAALPIILLCAVVFRCSLIPHETICSGDIYRYLWDGKVVAHGINPYAYAPDDPKVAHLASPLLPASVNHPSLGTVYPPLAEAFFAGAYFIVGESMTGFKAIIVLIDIGALLLLAWFLKHSGRPVENVILYAWSPLPILYGALDGHVDILGIPLLILVVAMFAERKLFLSGVAAAGAALVKLHPVVFAPLYLRGTPWWRGVAVCVAVVALFAAAYLPFAAHVGDEIRWLMEFGRNWEFNGGIFTMVYAATYDNQKAHMIMNILLAAWVVFLTFWKGDFTEKIFLACLGLILFSPLVHPWYLLWLAVMLVIRWSPSVFVLLGLSVVSNIIVYRYTTTGEWVDDPWIVAAQYVPFAIALVWEYRLSLTNLWSSIFLKER